VFYVRAKSSKDYNENSKTFAALSHCNAASYAPIQNNPAPIVFVTTIFVTFSYQLSPQYVFF
jgi:hypothetical protein